MPIFTAKHKEGNVTIEEALKLEDQAQEKGLDKPEFRCKGCSWQVVPHHQSKEFNNRQKRPHFEHFEKSDAQKKSHPCAYTD
jgi:hypothetical protein